MPPLPPLVSIIQLLHVYIHLLLEFACSLYRRIIRFDSNSPSTKSLRSLWLARNDRDPFVSRMNRALEHPCVLDDGLHHARLRDCHALLSGARRRHAGMERAGAVASVGHVGSRGRIADSRIKLTPATHVHSAFTCNQTTHRLVMQGAALLLLGRLWKAEVQERCLVEKVLANPLATFPLDLQQTTFMLGRNHFVLHLRWPYHAFFIIGACIMRVENEVPKAQRYARVPSARRAQATSSRPCPSWRRYRA